LKRIAGFDARYAPDDHACIWRKAGARAIYQFLIAQAVVNRPATSDDSAKARHGNGFAARQAHRKVIKKFKPPKLIDHRSIEMLGPKIWRVELMPIDQADLISGARKNYGRQCSADSAAYNQYIGELHCAAHSNHENARHLPRNPQEQECYTSVP
jgi:hypothetical protein